MKTTKFSFLSLFCLIFLVSIYSVFAQSYFCTSEPDYDYGPGQQNIVIPADSSATSMTVELWGGGGGGGGSYMSKSTGNDGSGGCKWILAPGGGGAAGEYVKATIPIKPGEIYNVVVGNYGAGGARDFYDGCPRDSVWRAASNGNPGGITSITKSDNSVSVTALGGAAGGRGAAQCVCGAYDNRGAGGVAASATSLSQPAIIGDAAVISRIQGAGGSANSWNINLDVYGGAGGAGYLSLGSGGAGGSGYMDGSYNRGGDNGGAGRIKITLSSGPSTDECCGDEPYIIASNNFDETFDTITKVNTNSVTQLDGVWEVGTYQNTGSLTFIWDPSIKHSGLGSAKMIFSNVDSHLHTKEIDLKPGTYTVSMWAKAENFVNVPASYQSLAYVGKVYAWINNQILGSADLYGTGTYDWTKKEFDFTLTEGRKVTIAIGSAIGRSSGTLWIDDVVIKRKLDTGDFGKTVSDSSGFESLCTIENDEWTYISASSFIYRIRQMGLQNDAISNGKEWYICNAGNFFPFNENTVFTSVNLPAPTLGIGEISDLDSYDATTLNQGDVQTGYSVDLDNVVYADNIFTGVTESPNSAIEFTPISNEPDLIASAAVIPYEAVSNIIYLNMQFSGLSTTDKITVKKILVSDSSTTTGWRATTHDLVEAVKSESGTSATITGMPIILYSTQVQSLQEGSHSLNITLILTRNGVQIEKTLNVFANAFVVPENTVTQDIGNPNKVYPGRFLCQKEGGNENSDEFIAGITECCGPIYNSCKNTNKNYTRISGGPNTLVKDYYGGDFTRNAVNRRGIPYYSENSVYQQIINDLMINSWKGYDALNFDFAIAKGKTQALRIEITDELNNVVFDDLVMKYSLSGNNYDNWHHVKIPLSNSMTQNRISQIKIYANRTHLEADAGSGIANANSQPHFPDRSGQLVPYYLIYGIDRFYLSSSDDALKEQFCITDYSAYGNTGSSKVGSWTNDLDKERDACNNVASYGWMLSEITTNGDKTACCGDDQGTTSVDETFYDENYKKAGCWRGMPVLNNSITNTDQNTNLLFYDGRFRACILDTTTFLALESRLSFMDFPLYFATHLKIPSLTNENSCTNKGDYYCDGLSSPHLWKSAFEFSDIVKVDSTKSIKNPSRPEEIPESVWLGSIPSYYRQWPITYDGENRINNYNTTFYPNNPPRITTMNLCCPASFCLNGTTCENSADYVNNPKKAPIFMAYGQTGYRCNRTGGWEVASLKPDYNREDTGYCTSQSDCYVDATSPCLVSGNWSISTGKERMCMDGAWTTRTKYVAAKLLEYAKEHSPTDYSLYCDEREKVLDETIMGDSTAIAYPLNSVDNAYGYFFAGSRSNNFCVLRFGETVIVGTSLNEPINDTNYPVYRAFGFNSSEKEGERNTAIPYDYETGDKVMKIYSSTESGKLFYSSKKQILFYSNDEDIAEFNPTFLEAAGYAIFHPIDSFTDFVISLFTSDDIQNVPLDTLTKYEDFDRVYFASKGGKLITGVTEKKYDVVEEDILVSTAIQYRGFTSDICTAVSEKQGTLRINCDNQTIDGVKIDTIVAAEPDESFFENVWPDLTAKIRIK